MIPFPFVDQILILVMNLSQNIKRIFYQLLGQEDKLLLDPYKVNSLEAMIYICALEMLADQKIRNTELLTLASKEQGFLMSAFIDAHQSASQNDLESDFQNVSKEVSYLDSDSLEQIIETAYHNLSSLTGEYVMQKAAQKILDEGEQKLCLLGAVRIAACDLEITGTENSFLNILAEEWSLEPLLKSVMENLPNWEKNRTSRLKKKINEANKDMQSLIAQGTISQATLTKLEEFIAKEAPSLEIPDDWEVFAEDLITQNQGLEEEVGSLAVKLAKAQKEIERQSSHGNDEESVDVVLQKNFKNLEFHPTAEKILLKQFPVKQDIYLKLSKMNSGHPTANKPLRGTKNWKELAKVKTGDASTTNLGRVYFKSHGSDAYLYKVFIEVKKDDAHQNQTVSLLRGWN